MNNDRTLDDEKTIHEDFELQALAVGALLCGGKYRLEEEAGKGGMGIVWKAWDLVGERWVALKFTSPGIRHELNAMTRLKAVFHTIQALSHPNICPVYGLENDSVYGCFVVKKWLEGKSLSEVKLPQAQIPVVLEKVADALDYAHSEMILHRDVKPSNIFLGTDGRVTLFDFGIAANLHSESQATRRQFSTSGTDKYMAPEQRNGQLQTVATDEYSLALVALELLAGTLSPLAFRKIPEEIQNVLNQALSDEPAERFATCREFVDALAMVMVPAPSVESGKVGAFEELVAKERRQVEESSLRETEKKSRQVQILEEKIQNAYQNERYEEAILDLNVLLKLQPENQNAGFLLQRREEKWETQKRKLQEQTTLDLKEKLRQSEAEELELTRGQTIAEERKKLDEVLPLAEKEKKSFLGKLLISIRRLIILIIAVFIGFCGFGLILVGIEESSLIHEVMGVLAFVICWILCRR